MYVERDGRQFGAGRVIVELVDASGRVVQTTSTAFDGFYVMSKVPFGEYRLRVSPQQQTELEQESTPIEKLVIDNESLFQSGLDFVLRSAGS